MVPFEFAVRDGFRALRAARHDLADWLRGLGADPEVIADIQLAVGELAVNATEAALDGHAEIQAFDEDGRVRVVVSNFGAESFRWTPATAAPEDRTAERGRGLRIAAALADSLEVVTVAGCTEATFIRSLATD